MGIKELQGTGVSIRYIDTSNLNYASLFKRNCHDPIRRSPIMQACWLTCAHYIMIRTCGAYRCCRNYHDPIRRSPTMQACWLTCAHYITKHMIVNILILYFCDVIISMLLCGKYLHKGYISWEQNLLYYIN